MKFFQCPTWLNKQEVNLLPAKKGYQFTVNYFVFAYTLSTRVSLLQIMSFRGI